MEYIFHDTDKELPETYEYLARLEAYLGKEIHKTRPDYSFDKWLDVYGGMIPSNHRRWCTRMLKLKPFEDYVGDDLVINYVGIRADEERAGYISSKPNITAVYPFREDGLVRADIVRILEDAGLGLPTFMRWGRTRSGCYFCFYQQKIEWVRLKETYPELFDKAKAYEHANKKNGNAFYWNGEEPLEELERPERMDEIKRNWEQDRERARRNSPNLVHILGGLGEEEEEREGCLICQL
jgi:3'-phosphoadenosine 5'-phosphosulfate sulfotransferase (PAPS reductase)/FAD synthetase